MGQHPGAGLAGIDASTLDPDDGRIERDRTGRRPGHSTRVPPTSSSGCSKHTEDEWLDAFRTGQAYLHSLGVTAWQDAIVPPDFLAVYRRAAETGS